MPSETLNRTEELVNEIGYPDDTEDEAHLQDILEQAHGDMQTAVGRNFVEDKRVRKRLQGSNDLVNTFQLKFAPILEVDEILLNEFEVIDESNYTVDKENGSVSIDQSFIEDEMYQGQTVRLKYKPKKFKTIELWRAIAIAKNQELQQLEDSEQNAQYSNALRRAKRLENQVNRSAGPGSARDGDTRRGTK